MLLVPISAHALFARPLVTAPTSVIAVELQRETPQGVLWCDGRRSESLPAGARVEVSRGLVPVRLARLRYAHSRPACCEVFAPGPQLARRSFRPLAGDQPRRSSNASTQGGLGDG
jgi:hypothetical protein